MSSTAINWGPPKNLAFKFHPLYIKYNNLPFSGIDANLVKADLNGVIATSESSGIVAYLSWLLRVLALLA